MPTSNPWHIPVVLHFAMAVRPMRILDIGVGMGCYGFLLRQFTDIASERIDRNSWKVRIEGVEIYQKYRNPTWEFAYDEIHCGDIRTLLPKLGTYDVVICADVLEHFDLPEARELIRSIVEKAGVLIATTPSNYYPQGAWGGNDAETHHCVLAQDDFQDLVAVETTGVTTCYVCCKNAEFLTELRTAAKTCPRYHQSVLRSLPRRIANKLAKVLHR